MNFRRIAASLALTAVAVVIGTVAADHSLRAGTLNLQKFTLFSGVDYADSSEVASVWIPVYGASKVVIRTWTPHLAFGQDGNTADSTKVDSITTWKTLFSDSVSFMAKDSLGTLVRASSTIPNEAGYQIVPICGDSLSLTDAAVDSTKMVGVYGVAKNKELRSAANGSGVTTIVYPLRAGNLESNDGIITAKYMRIRITPVGRATGDTKNATVPNKTTGLRKVRMEAIVWRKQD